MEDYLVRVITRAANIRALACVTTQLVNEASRRNGAYPTAAAALGRALTGGALLGALLKTGQRVALKFEGNGPLRKIVVEADSDGSVRGYVAEPEVDLPPRNGKLDVGSALGREGLLTVSKDLRLKEPYRGTVQLYSGEIAEDIAYYLTESEQTPSAVGLGVFVEPNGTVSAAGGFLIQSLPPADDEVLDALIRQIQAMAPVTELLRKGKLPEDLMSHVFDGLDFDILARQPLALQCSCSRERVESALVSLGRQEISEIISEKKEVDVRCEFCRENYVFSLDELQSLLSAIH